MKRVTRCILFLFIISLVMTGCGNETKEDLEKNSQLMQQALKMTEQAIQNKDVKIARELWSQISEYGVTAKDLGEEELADSLGELAATYADLVDYIETDDKEALEKFKQEFSEAERQVRKMLEKK